ncbi:hypothetical protein K469DRAFT_623292 [Zopfia rhizophila CBS 207.26]|uniref:Uncharacterized protein n=1 Tax=Zopfia rhizophila CBS 207.26 TaxID=1314779 RepID=A0A6A6EJI6_9PEZI|nr:hypothetical protein K469DRAFT_623292 [Zopfia rhizophila CBS 207.26]
MAPPTKKPSKPIFKTDTPFTETKWPEISPQDQGIILDLLCNLLEPLGHNRKTHIHSSKGKKRKRTTVSSPITNTTTSNTSELPPPPSPTLAPYLTIGLNTTTRHLTTLASSTLPKTLPTSSDPKGNGDVRPLSIVIIPHPNPTSSLPYAHIPTLLALVNIPSPPNSRSETREPTRLILLPSSSEGKLASALGIPRVGAIGIMEGAPGADTLVDYVRKRVGGVECKWVEEAMGGEWRGVRVRSQMN